MGKPPATEWVIHDRTALINALKAIQAKRKFSLEDLFVRMGARLLNRFLRNEQANLQTDTLFKAMDALGVEWVIREPKVPKGTKRLDLIRAQQAQKAESGTSAPVDLDRDEQGKLTRALTPEEYDEVERTLARYTDL